MQGYSRAAVGVVLGMIAFLPSATAEQGNATFPQRAATRDCFSEFLRGKSSTLRCEFPTRLTDEERGDLERLTRGMLLDARCMVAINVERRVIEDAIAADDMVVELPPQPVSCEVSTKETVYPIAATFQPRVVFRGGIAVEGSPGLANLTGVSKYLAWPVVQYVNRSAGVGGRMTEIVNLWREHLRGRGRAKGA